jgi:cytolysin-activating lysine-acyltransferase
MTIAAELQSQPASRGARTKTGATEKSADILSTKANGAAHIGNAAVAEAISKGEPLNTAGKTAVSVLGEIVWLMAHSPRHKIHTFADLEWLVLPPIMLNQFQIFYANEKPIGVTLWASVNDIVGKRIDLNEKRLTAAEWKSGPQKRIIEIIAPFGGEQEMRDKFIAFTNSAVSK